MASTIRNIIHSKRHNAVVFASVAVALYGYDQGMMSLVNTNYDYLSTMGIAEDSPLVGVIVAVYYLGCTIGAMLGSNAADRFGRKTSIFSALATASIGNLLMFISGLGDWFPAGTPAFTIMLIARVVMGLGVGGIDAVVPVYSSELNKEEHRGRALAQEFQANILGLNLAFAVNLICTYTLGKYDQWAWRIPIIVMQAFSLTILLIVNRLPESPRYYVFHNMDSEAEKSLKQLFPEGEEYKDKIKELTDARDQEDDSIPTYLELLFRPSHDQWHPTMLTVMAQVNQALTGYGAISVYGPQIFELLGFGVMQAEFITQGNYVSYLLLMTLSWMLIDRVGRRPLMVWCSVGLVAGFVLLTVLGGIAEHAEELHLSNILAVAIPGTVVLFANTGFFGVGWLPEVFLIPTEIYPTAARAKGTAVSVIIWGLANFTITLVTPPLFNNLSYLLFAVFAATNAFAGWFTWMYQLECGGRTFEENQEFFTEAKKAGTWNVGQIRKGEFLYLPGQEKNSSANDQNGERQPLLNNER